MREKLQNIERSFVVAEDVVEPQLREKYEHALHIIKEQMGLQSLEEIFIEDKEIFSECLSAEQKKKFLDKLFDNQDVTERI